MARECRVALVVSLLLVVCTIQCEARAMRQLRQSNSQPLLDALFKLNFIRTVEPASLSPPTADGDAASLADAGSNSPFCVNPPDAPSTTTPPASTTPSISTPAVPGQAPPLQLPPITPVPPSFEPSPPDNSNPGGQGGQGNPPDNSNPGGQGGQGGQGGTPDNGNPGGQGGQGGTPDNSNPGGQDGQGGTPDNGNPGGQGGQGSTPDNGNPGGQGGQGSTPDTNNPGGQGGQGSTPDTSNPGGQGGQGSPPGPGSTTPTNPPQVGTNPPQVGTKPPVGIVPPSPIVVVPSPPEPGTGGGGGGGGGPFQPPIVYPPPLAPPMQPGAGQPLWCVAKPTVPDPIMQEAMDYACGTGAECGSIQPSGACYQPNTVLAHASFAFNSYWQQSKAAGGTCDFGGTATIVTRDPSYEKCKFDLL